MGHCEIKTWMTMRLAAATMNSAPYAGYLSILRPLVPVPGLPNVRLKLDFLMPTLSFKDRGAVLLATLARRLGVERAVVDSSGNAGTAAAAYLARAGVPCEVFVPEATSPGKLAQMRAHGATVRVVSGTRADTAAAAMSAADTPGTFYASHVYHPYFLHGVKTYAYEIWEQSGRVLPDTVVVPVGNGTLVLGCYLAFRELLQKLLHPRRLGGLRQVVDYLIILDRLQLRAEGRPVI